MSISLMTDTDNTKTAAQAFYGPLTLVPDARFSVHDRLSHAISGLRLGADRRDSGMGVALYPLVPLASSARSKHQACVARGTSVYGIQFHPELRLEDLKARLKRYGYLDKPERQALVKDNLHETPDTDHLIRRFLEIFVLEKSPL